MRGLTGTLIRAATVGLFTTSPALWQPGQTPDSGHAEVTYTKDVLPILPRSISR